MIYNLVVWVFLLSFCFVLGNAMLYFVQKKSEQSPNSAFPLAVWTGVSVLGFACLLLSLAGPVSLERILILYAASITLTGMIQPLRYSAINALLKWRCSSPLGLLTLILACAIYFSQAPAGYDTLLYHHQSARWFGSFGAVKGLALIHYRFGFVSSWFACAGPLTSYFTERSASLLNGFIFVLAFIHLSSALNRTLTFRSQNSDRFLLPALSMVLGLHLALLEPLGTSPDLALNLMTVILFSWLIRLSERDRCDVPLGALIFFTTLIMIKLSALPVVLTVGILLIIGGRTWQGKMKRLAGISLLNLIILIPVMLVSIKVSGTALFPIRFLSFNLPWSLDSEIMSAAGRIVRDWARWNGPAPSNATDLNWLHSWLLSPKGILFLTLGAGNLIATAELLRKKNRLSGNILVLATPLTGLVSTLYFLILAPNPRFGFGSLSLGWSWLIYIRSISRAKNCNRSALVSETQTKWRAVSISIIMALILGVFIAFPTDSWRKAYNNMNKNIIWDDRDGRINWLLPAKLPAIGFRWKEGGGALYAYPLILRCDRCNDFRYFYPENSDICGPAPLPAAPHSLYNIRLANPEIGIPGGFVRDRYLN